MVYTWTLRHFMHVCEVVNSALPKEKNTNRTKEKTRTGLPLRPNFLRKRTLDCNISFLEIIVFLFVFYAAATVSTYTDIY